MIFPQLFPCSCYRGIRYSPVTFIGEYNCPMYTLRSVLNFLPNITLPKPTHTNPTQPYPTKPYAPSLTRLSRTPLCFLSWLSPPQLISSARTGKRAGLETWARQDRTGQGSRKDDNKPPHQAVTPGVIHSAAYHRPSDGHFYE